MIFIRSKKSIQAGKILCIISSWITENVDERVRFLRIIFCILLVLFNSSEMLPSHIFIKNFDTWGIPYTLMNERTSDSGHICVIASENFVTLYQLQPFSDGT